MIRKTFKNLKHLFIDLPSAQGPDINNEGDREGKVLEVEGKPI